MQDHPTHKVKKRSIKKQILRLVVTICLVVLVVTSVIDLTTSILQEKDNVVRSLQTTADIVGNQSTAAIEFDDRATATENVSSLRNTPNVVTVCLYSNAYDNHGAKLAHYTSQEAPEPCPVLNKHLLEEGATGGHTFTWERVHLFHRIVQQHASQAEEVIGVVYIEASLSHLYQLIARHFLIVVLSLVIAVIIAIYLTRCFERSITSPIIRLAKLANLFSQTKDYRLRAHAHTRDEVGELGGAVNMMLERMEQNERDLLVAKEQADEARLRADEANQMKGEFLANMSHEIRTPMNGIMGMTELLLETNLTHKQQNYARTVINSAEALLNIINDILDFSKIESGKLELEPIAFDFMTVVEDSADLLAVKAREKAVELVVRYVPRTPHYLIGDPGRIRQIIHNLVGNAIKFTEKGYVMILVEEVPAGNAEEAGRHTIKVSVSDTGIGISKEAQQKIFDKFSQADTSTTRKFGGTGLGLAISQQLVQMMGGDIGVKSEPGKGSTFWFTMTLEADTTEHEEEPIGDTLEGMQVLVVDDIEANGTLIGELLEPMGAAMHYCDVPSKALAILEDATQKGEPFDMAIVDYLMPEMNGEQLARAICDHEGIQDLAMVMLTSAGGAGYSRRFREAGFLAYFSKPVKPQELNMLLPVVWQKYQAGERDVLITSDSLQSKNRQKAQTREMQFSGLHVLLAEDNRVNQGLAVEMLEQAGCEVEVVVNGKQALEAVQKGGVDLILMDCEMPEMDGFEASRILTEWKAQEKIADIPIVALTGNAMKGDKERCLEAGMQDYVTKPIRRNQLLGIIAKWKPDAVVVQVEDAYHFEGRRVLLVEDNRINRAMAEEMLEELGFTVTSAENGRIAVEKITEEGPFNVVLMDCQMPEMDGFEATAAIRTLQEEGQIDAVPIVALTANAMKGDKEACLKAGMDDYISKPVKRKVLQTTLARWVAPKLKVASPNDEAKDTTLMDHDIFDAYKEVMGEGLASSIDLFITDSRKLIQKLVDSYTNNEVQTLASMAHTLKSTSAALGLQDFSMLAKSVEEDARTQLTSGGKASHIPSHRIVQISEAFEEVAVLLKQYLPPK